MCRSVKTGVTEFTVNKPINCGIKNKVINIASSTINIRKKSLNSDNCVFLYKMVLCYLFKFQCF